MIALILREHAFRRVCLLAFFQRGHERRPAAQHRRDGEHRRQTPEHGTVEEHLPHANVDRERGEVLPE